MDCVNHSGVDATSYCQSCGKPLCETCVRKGSAGQVLCEPCFTTWQARHSSYVPPPMGGPSPGLAAILGAIPGVGAMYNGQFVKGMVHVVIFAVLVSAAHIYHVFGLFVFAWICYQMFEAYHTARARRDGDPLPDPLGLNEDTSWFATGGRPPHGPPPGAATGPGTNPNAGPSAPGQTHYQPPYQSPYQAPFQTPFQGPFTSPPGAGPGFPPIPPVPPIPPTPPLYWRRKEPIGAVVLIALGVMFLLGQFDWFSWHLFDYFWPLLLIGLGAWMIVRRMQEVQGPPPNGPQGNSQGGPK
jgi:hypothetical protein